MNLKFLAPPVSLAALLLGLSYVDASPAELVTRAPERVELPASVSRDGSAEIQGYTNLYSSCETIGGYNIEYGQNEILIRSYVNATLDKDCAQDLEPEVPHAFTIMHLNPRHSYRVFFRTYENDAVEVGQINAAF